MRETKYLIILYIILLIITGCDSSEGPIPSSGCHDWPDPDTTDPFKILVESKCFRLGPVGFAAVTPPEKIALLRLIERKDASAVLEQLYTKGKTAGKLYALIGLRIVDKYKYNELVPQLRDDASMVDTMGGCIILTEPVQQIVEAIDEGLYEQLLYESQSR